MPFYRYEIRPGQPDSEMIEIKASSLEVADQAFAKMLAQMGAAPPGGEPSPGGEPPPGITPGAPEPPAPGVAEAAGPPETQNPYGPNPYDPAMLSGFPGMAAIPDQGQGRALLGGFVDPILGFNQAAIAFEETVGALPKGATSEYSRRTEEFREALLGDDPEENLKKLRTMTSFGVNLGLGAAIPGAGAGYWVTAARAAWGGGATAAVMFEEGANRAQKTGSIALGALLGGMFSTTLYALPAAKKSVMTYFLNRSKQGTIEEHVDEMEELFKLFPQLRDEVTIGQRTLAPGQMALESQVGAEAGIAAYRKQYQILKTELDRFGERWGGIWKPEDLATVAAERGRYAMRRVLRDMAKVRKTEYNALHDVARDAVSVMDNATYGAQGGLVVGGQKVMSLPRLEETFGKVAREFGLPSSGEKLLESLSPRLQAALREFRAFKGEGISLDRLIELRKALNGKNFVGSHALPAGEGQAGQQFSAALKKAIDAEVRKMDGPVGDALRAADASYAARSAEMEVVRRSLSAKQLGLDKATATPYEALVAITKQSPEDAANTARWLSEYDPDLLSEIRGVAWREAMQTAQDATGVSSTVMAMDPTKFASEMMKVLGQGSKRAGRYSGRFGDVPEGEAAAKFASLFSEGEAAQLRFIMGKIQDINMAPPTGQALNVDPRALFQTLLGAIPGVSGKNLDSIKRAAPFLASAYYRWVFSKHPDKGLFTTEGRKLLEESYKTFKVLEEVVDSSGKVVRKTFSSNGKFDPIKFARWMESSLRAWEDLDENGVNAAAGIYDTVETAAKGAGAYIDRAKEDSRTRMPVAP